MVVDNRSAPNEEATDLLFHALADATRRDIVRRTLQRDHSVSDLAGHYSMSFAAVQKHVAILERAELVTKRRHGRERIVCGRIETARRVNRLLDELEAIWRGRLQRFGEVLLDDITPATNNHSFTSQPDTGDPR
jgi:DNA-binding transcriptional ArsR family regulator